VGRLAQLGIAFLIIGEIITGKGTLAQLNIETGVPITDLEPLILFNVTYFLVAATNPGTGKFVNDNDVVSELVKEIITSTESGLLLFLTSMYDVANLYTKTCRRS